MKILANIGILFTFGIVYIPSKNPCGTGLFIPTPGRCYRSHPRCE